MNWRISKRFVCMEQDLCKIGIIGAGPAGCSCAYFIKKFAPDFQVVLIDYSNPMRTILPTGGGRCNLANAEFDFKELAKNYPRGEKFLYSVFSRFSTGNTLELFSDLGIETYCQDDGRIFPVSDSSKEVMDKFNNAIKNCGIIKEKALRIEVLENGFFKVVTDMNSYVFDKVVFSTGGHNGYEMIERIGVSVVSPKPSLVGLVSDKKFADLMGTVAKNVYNKNTGLYGDVLFTHFGISGPLVYKISSLYAREEIPYDLEFDLCSELEDLQSLLNNNPHKQIKNLLGEYMPNKLGEYILNDLNIKQDVKCHKIDGKTRDMIENSVHNFKFKIMSTKKDGETVTSGGVSLNMINPKTMESKEIPNLYFCGEVIDVDGFCGGFNLQNCWSTAYVCACGIVEK